MSRRHGMMSDQLKEEIARELGFYDTVQEEGWGGIKSRDAGNMVKQAVQMAEQSMSENKK
ncbi:small, acid-soluble spore protein, alpha/beta type [Salibacterium salarium]|uniref:Small, acid-soluble spore protein, alpha/beta type n=1 Tax=Salibacterium salarium TaxID=284579 RepID=A0A428MTW7_9BACI|nr:small, acid-soluble spore protein, alpha/beta type [Salibacterium salarium]RSL29574.1 small, acid-soluble spore protein, alpha/beta type [Salibacterium salarium]